MSPSLTVPLGGNRRGSRILLTWMRFSAGCGFSGLGAMSTCPEVSPRDAPSECSLTGARRPTKVAAIPLELGAAIRSRHVIAPGTHTLPGAAAGNARRIRAVRELLALVQVVRPEPSGHRTASGPMTAAHQSGSAPFSSCSASVSP